MAMMNCSILVIIISNCLIISFPGAAATATNLLPHHHAAAAPPTNHVPHGYAHAPLAAAAAGMPLINPGIQKICSATSNPKVCARSLGGPHVVQGQTRVDPTWALVQQAHAGINATQRAIALADRVLRMDDNCEECVQVCVDSYDSVMDSWRDALTSLQLGNDFDVANHLTAVSSMTMSCEDAFSDDDPTVLVFSPFTKLDRLILKMASNALDIHQMIFPRSH